MTAPLRNPERQLRQSYGLTPFLVKVRSPNNHYTSFEMTFLLDSWVVGFLLGDFYRLKIVVKTMTFLHNILRFQREVYRVRRVTYWGFQP